MPKFYVSGIIQIEVAAKDATEAGQKALARAESLMKSPSLNIGIEVETAEPVPEFTKSDWIGKLDG